MTNNPLESSMGELLPDYPDLDRHTRPALAKLADDQHDVLLEFLEGFRDRRHLLEWSQRCIVATLGEVEESWPTDLAMNRSDLSVVITSEKRHTWVDDGEAADKSAAKAYRRALAAEDLIPAFRSAYRKMRWNAVEYVNDEDDSLQPDPSIQRHPAMRPALSEMAERQEWALKRLLDGLDDHDQLMSWVLRAVEASHGELEGELATDLYTETHTRRMLVVDGDDHRHGPFFRESFGATTLLPAFVRAARKLSEKSGELVEQEKKEITPTQL